MSVVIENLDRDIAAIKKRRGPDAIYNGSDEPPILRIPLESPGLMRITGGGIPLGRVSRLWGSPGSAKSLIGWEIIKQAQKLNFLTCYWDIEKQYSKDFTKMLGVDVSKMKVNDTDIIEDVARELQLLLGSIHVHVLDSVSEGKPQDRIGKDPGDWDVGLKVRVWEKAWDYIMNALDKHENAVIAISHSSRDFTTKSEKPLDGKEIEHISGLSLQFKKSKWLYYDSEYMLQTEDKLKEKGILGIAGQKEADGQEIIIKTTKSRTCRPFKVANLRLDLNTFKFDHTFELMQAAEYYDKWGNIAHRSGTVPIAHKKEAKGGWATLPDGSKLQGERQLRQRIEEDADLQKTIRKAMLAGN